MKILFISLSNIGDAVMTTPVLQKLCEIYPDATFDIVAGKRSADVFRFFPKKSELYIKDKQGFLRGYYHLWKQLRKCRYDLIVDLRFDGFTYLLRAKKRLTKGSQSPENERHAVEEHMSAIATLNQDGVIPATTIWLDETSKNFALKIISEFSGDSLLSVGPGCGGPEKVWLPERYARACNELGDQLGGVVLLGGQGDVEYCQGVSDNLDLPFVNLSGKTGILEAAAVIAQTKCFIGNDSGLGHLASAVKTPSVSLFGVGYPRRYHPWQDASVWLSGANENVNNIQVAQVTEQINGILRA